MKLRQMSSVMLGVLVIGLVGVAAYFGVSYIVQFWSRLDRSVAFVTATAIVTALLAARWISDGPARAVRMTQQFDLKKRQAEVYCRLLQALVLPGEDNPYSSPNDLKQLELQLLVYGEPSVLAAYKKVVDVSDEDSPAVIVALSELAKSMRSSLGSAAIDGTDLAVLLVRQGSVPQPD